MPIPFDREIVRITNVVRLKKSLFGNDTDWMAWWYCGIYKNHLADSQPNILVAFRAYSAGSLSDLIVLRRIPLTALGQVRIGTIWKESMCRAEAVFDVKKFKVDFTKGAWKLTSFHKTAKEGVQPPYPSDVYRLQYGEDKNWLVEFKLPSGGKLIVPCIEFFSRCYGRSEELKRVLATYQCFGENSIEKYRLFAKLDESEESGKWKVKLGKRLVNDDVVFLAHAKYDPYTERIANDIYSTIESQYDPENKKPAFIKAPPWFQGPAEIKVKGIWFDNRQSFLGLQVIGCSDPEGLPILRDRENTNKTDAAAEEDGIGEAWAGAPERVLMKYPDIINLTSDDEPDHGSATVEIQDPDFEVLGTPRVVIDVRRDRAKGSAGARGNGSDVSAFSSGEPHGDKKGVGYASIHARSIMESKGALRDMWDAMLFLKTKFPDLIKSVEWYTFQDEFSKDAEPKPIAVHAFEKEDEVTTEVRNWPYLNATTKLELRGVLVARVVAGGKTVHFIEIQRRPQRRKDKTGDFKDSEESYKGLVFVLEDQLQFETWLKRLLSDIRHVKGVWQRLVGFCPGNAAVFKHTPSSGEQVSCEAAVMNALEKVGVTKIKSHKVNVDLRDK